MKNRRAVCLAKDAGFIEYPGLPGHIKTGCMSSPQFKSRYCKQHVTRACCGESGQGTTLSDPEASVPVESAVVEMLLAKKETRGQTYYQVYDTFNLL